MNVRPISITVVAVSVVGLLALAPAAGAINDNVDLPAVVQTDPVDWTPQVPGTWGTGSASDQYQVMTLAPLGNLMYAGGLFPVVTNATKTISYARNNIFSFNVSSGAVTSFAPDFDGQVNAIVPSQDGQSLFVGGAFTHVNGVARGHFAKINATTGALVPGFPNVKIAGKVTDIDIVGSNVVVGGKFSTVNGTTRTGLASLNPDTGALTNYMNITLGGQLNATSPQGVWRFAVTADKSKMAVTGSFLTVNGQSRLQLFLLNLGATSATLANWDAPILHVAACSQKSQGNAQVIGDLDFSADGTKLYIGSGGGPHGTNTICDAAIKFPVNVTGTNVVPDWANYTNGDTLRSVAWTTNAVYVAGHQRWLQQSPGVYASRPGIGAIAPANNQLLTWNPGHNREIGTQELIVTNGATQPGQLTGLWVGSDSGGCGMNVGETRNHEGICFFPN